MKRPKHTAGRLTAEQKRGNLRAVLTRNCRAVLARDCCESYTRALGSMVEHELAVQRLKDFVRDYERGASA